MAFTEITHKRSFIKRPIDLVLHIFKAILSPVYAKRPKDKQSRFKQIDDPTTVPKGRLGNTQTSVISKNFFARWMKMTGFHKRWFALPLFEEDVTEGGCFPLIKETGGYGALRSLQKHAGRRKGNAWDMFLRIYTKMYMEISMMPAPASAIVQKKTGKIIGTSFTDEANEFRGLLTFCVKPQCLFSLPPMCNVMFPSVINRIRFQESYMAQPTRVKIRGGHGSNLARQLMAGTDAVYRSIIKQILNTGYPSVVYKRGKMYEKSPGANDDNFLLFPEEMFKGPVIKRMAPPPWMRVMQRRAGGRKTSKSQLKTSEGKTLKQATDPTQTSTTAESRFKLTDGARELFQKYAEYEFFRARYEARSGSVNCVFQPFLVPGYPGVAFDQRKSGLDILGYLTAVSHAYDRTAAEQSTTASLAFIRTLQEEERDQIQEPISSVREIMQDEENASEYYRSIFFRKQDVSKDTAYIKDNVVETDNELYGTVKPTAEYKDAFENYGAAMRAVARPGCTLKEYVETYHNKDIDTLLEEGTVQAEYRSFYSVTRDATPDKSYGGAVYWGRIYKLKQGSGPNPGSKVTNIQDDLDESPSSGGFTPVDDTHGDMPQTRYDWDEVLEEYRRILYTELAPQE